MKRKWGACRAPPLAWGNGESAPSGGPTTFKTVGVVPKIVSPPPATGGAGDHRQRAAQAVQYNARRGSADVAREIAGDPDRLAAAVNQLRQDFFGSKVHTVKKSKRALAEELAILAGYRTIYPLSVELVTAVAAALKAGGFRSAASYLSELKLKHIEENFVIEPALGRLLKLATDSTERGIGPASKAAEAQLEEFDLETANDNVVIGGSDSYVVAVCWLLREIELANVKVDKECLRLLVLSGRETVTLNLPTSKTDTKGKGAARTLAHECDIPGSRLPAGARTCPVCAVKRQLERLKANWGCPSLEDVQVLDLPLFPAPGGGTASKQTMIAAWKKVHRAASPDVQLSGHSARRTGAKRRAKQGWSLWQIQFMGR